MPTDSPDETDKCLETQKLPEVTWEVVEIINSTIAVTEEMN